MSGIMDKKLGRMCEIARATAEGLYATVSVNGSSPVAENITEIDGNDTTNGYTAFTNTNLPESANFHEAATFTQNIEASSSAGLNLDKTLEKQNLSQQPSFDSFPYEWFREYMETMKKDMIREISKDVIRNVTEILTKQLILKPSDLQQLNHVRNESNPVPTEQYDLPMSNIQSWQENVYKVLHEKLKHKNASSIGVIKENTCSTDDIETKWEIRDGCLFQRLPDDMHIVCVNDLDKGGRNQEDCISNGGMTIKQELYPTAKLSSLQSEIEKATCSKCDIQDVPIQGENQLRMNCSITGHQMLNESHVKDPMVCSGSDIDNISTCSVASNNSDVQSISNFEVIHLLPRCESKESDFSNLNAILYKEKVGNNCTLETLDTARYNHVTHKGENNGSSRESPSFELLSESASPSLSVYIDEERPCHNENMVDPGISQEEYMTSEQNAAAVLSNANDTSSQPQLEKILCNKSDSLEAAKPVEKEPRMNCSITGHQILNKTNVKNVMLCSASEKNSINLCFSTANNVESDCDHNFEVVQIPECGEVGTCKKSNETSRDKKLKNNTPIRSSNNSRFNVVIYHVGNNRSSSSMRRGSFECLSDTTSPALSIYINDDKFSCNDSDIHDGKNVHVTKCNNNDDETETNKQEYNPPQTSGNEKLCTNCDADNCGDIGFEKRSGGAYSFVADTLPVQTKEAGTCSFSKFEHDQQQQPRRGNTNVDVKRSHTSYPTKAESNEYAWSNIPLNNFNHNHQQADANEFAQSFHSHTTSITDTTGHTAASVKSSSRGLVMTKHRINKTSHGTASYCSKTSNTKVSSPKKVFLPVKILATVDPIYTKITNPEISSPKKSLYPIPCLPTIDTFQELKSSQKFREKSEGNPNRRKLVTTTTGILGEPVQILPESLVTGMPHVASLACVTARRVCDRILRRYAKEIFYQTSTVDLNDRRRE